ncbi:MAG TPA: Hsp20/alpha crystallin family protein [Acidimicrobiales bacterium]|jgi:HSP20 family protein
MDPNIAPPRLTTDLPGRDPSDLLAEAIQESAHPQSVPVNMYETDEAVVIVAALPGVGADDIEVEIERHTVTIRSDVRSLAPKAYILHEWHYGPYERMVELPEGFEGDPSASYGNGQLAIRVGRGGRRSESIIVQPAG